jgi:broad specificity phosphatase PhoE
MDLDLILVRHGETKFNRADVFRGRADLELDDRGFEQARAAADYLSDLDFEAFYCSPLRRAVQTAEAIAAPHGGNVRALTDFIDVDYGDWSGKSVDEVRERWPGEMASWIRDPERLVFPGGESMYEAWKRVKRGLAAIEEERHARVLLVAHKLINRIILCQILGMPVEGIWRIEQDNGAINAIAWRATGAMLVEMNTTCHLRDIKSNRQDT